MPKTHRIVVVKWRDACLCGPEYTLKDCLELTMPIYETYGIILGRDKTTLRLACEERIDIERFRQVNLIPIDSIISIRTLKR